MRNPQSPIAWIRLARACGGAPSRAIDTYDLKLTDWRFLRHYPEIKRRSAATLGELAARAGCSDPETVASAIAEIVRWKTIIQCRHAHRAGGGYFIEAEAPMAWQWQQVIWPIIKDADFRCTLELACGHGRNTEYLRQYASELHLVDVNESCLAACRQRFGVHKGACRFYYHRTEGAELRAIPNRSITFGYSWDSMVHFDKLVMRDYVLEFARILAPGGTAFLHHSNLGAALPESNWFHNHGSRSNMSAKLMQAYVAEAGLAMRFQRLSGTSDGWGMEELDCLSLVEQPVK
jgi:SAM-dependent methyltransferase